MEIVSGLSQLHPGVHPHHIGNIQPDDKLDIGAAGVATQNEYGVAILDRFHALQSPRHVRTNPKKEKNIFNCAKYNATRNACTTYLHWLFVIE